MSLGRLHVITGDRSIACAALAAGAPVIQVRAKGLTDREVFELACDVVAEATHRRAKVLVNDRVHVAAAAGAAGAHVGENDLPVRAVRRVLGPDAVVGGTARDPQTARAHQAAGASYLGVGPAYATSTKSGLPVPLGPARVGEIVGSVTIPVIAIAGVNAGRVRELLDAGAYGVAVAGAVADADDPYTATEELLRVLERHA